MPYKDLIKPHNEKKGAHCYEHSEWNLPAMEKGSLILQRLLGYKIIEVLNSFRDDIYQRDGEKERSCEGHGEVHDSFGLEALEARDEVTEYCDLEEECHHEH